MILTKPPYDRPVANVIRIHKSYQRVQVEESSQGLDRELFKIFDFLHGDGASPGLTRKSWYHARPNSGAGYWLQSLTGKIG